MLRVLINCPGSWSHGLDSPERGEGRWAQNLARCLAKSGLYQVMACSGGTPTWGRGEVVPNIELLSEQEAERRGPFDLYFDASWYEGKRPAAQARHNFHVHFGYEPRLGVPLPPNHYLVYVLKWCARQYEGEGRGNADRTFYLPAPFAPAMLRPDFNRRKILHTMRGSDAAGRADRFARLHEAVNRLRSTMAIPLAWISAPGLPPPSHSLDRGIVAAEAWGIPDCEIRSELRDCGLNPAIDGWSNVLDCTALGVPSLAWHGGAYTDILVFAEKHGLAIEEGASVDRIAEIIGRLYSDPVLYHAYTADFQAAFSDHVEPRTLELFAQIAARVG